MRTKNSIRNSLISALCYGMIMIGSFVTRAVFKRVLGNDLVGVEGVFLSAVNMLAIVELGIGTGILYKLYKPLAEDDKEKIATLIRFFKEAYIKISWIIFALGIGGAFIAPFFISEGDFQYGWLAFIFLFYVLDVLSSYLYAHKRALFMADQKNYILVLYHTLGQVSMSILQIVVLVVFRSFIGYLIIKIVCRVVENMLISWHYKRYYFYIDYKVAPQLPDEEKKDIFSTIKAMLFHKIGGFTMSSSASIISSVFISTAMAGFYSNYMMITNGIVTLATHFFDGIVASFGDLVATAQSKRVNENFNAIYFVNYIIISFCAVFLFVVGNPLVALWIGSEAAFTIVTIALISLYFFINGMRQSVLLVRNSAGLYKPDQYFPILEAILNIGLSLLFVQFWGINGIVLANALSLFLVPFWTQPIIVHKYILQKSPLGYYLRYAMYLVVTILAGALTYAISTLVPFTGIARLFVNILLCLIVPNIINIIVFYKTKEFRYLWGLFDELILCKLLKRGA